MTKRNSQISDAAAAAFLFLSALGVYIFTALPAIIFEDTGEFPVSSAQLGVSHPPGYPLYVMIGHLFSRLPFTEPAFGVVLFSCFCGAAGCCLVFAACRSLGFSKAGSFIGGAALAVSYTLWSQCVISEVYALQILLSAALLCCVAGARRGKHIGIPLAAISLLGLNFLNQYIAFVAFAPLIAACFLAGLPDLKGRVPAALAAGAVLLAAVISLSMYLPLRAAAAPALQWGDATTFMGFLELLKRTQFFFYENQLGFHLPTKIEYAKQFITALPGEFTPAFIFIAMMGAFLCMVERWKLFAVALYLFLIHSAGVIIFINFHYSPEFIAVFRVFYLGAFMIAAVMVAAGADGIIKKASEGAAGESFRPRAAAAALLLLALWPLAQNFTDNNWSREDRSLRFGRDIFRSIKRDGVFFIYGAMHMPSTEYLQIIKHLRGDVISVDGHGTMQRSNLKKYGYEYNYMDMPEIEKEIARDIHENTRAYFAYELVPDQENLPWMSMKNLGPVFEAITTPGEKACDQSIWAGSAGDFRAHGRADNFETSMLDGFILSRQAQCRFQMGDTPGAFEKIKVISERYPDNSYVSNSIASLMLRFGYEGKAIKYYEEAIRLCPTYTEAYTMLGDIYTRKGQIAKAKQMYKTVLKLNPTAFTTMMNLANVHQYRAEFVEALALYNEVLELQPDAALVYNNLGNTYSSMGRWDDAQRAFRKAIRMSPYLSFTYNNLGALYISRADYGRAIDELTKFVEMEPRSATGWYNLGFAFQSEGNYNKALESYGKSAELEPGQVSAWKRIVSIQVDQGEVGEARKTIAAMRRKSDEIKAESESRIIAGGAPLKEVKLLTTSSMLLKELADQLEKGLKK